MPPSTEYPIVSVCMITYNHRDYIHEAIAGVLSQIVNFSVELVIADDCSPDNTMDVLNSPFIKNHPNNHWIKYTRHEVNKGMIPNFIWASGQCRGKYIALCEGDDYWTDTLKLQKQFDFLEANSEYSGCFHKVNIIDQNKEIIGDLPVNLTKTDFIFDDLVKGWFIPTASLFYRNYEIHNAIAQFKNIISGDRLIVALVADKGKLRYMDAIMGVYRKHPGGISSWANRIAISSSNLGLFRQLLDYFKPRYRVVLINQMFRWSGSLSREYFIEKKYVKFIKQMFITALYIRTYMDFKGFIKNYLLGKK